MPSPTELRVFISSTFRDLQEEREHLVKKIFPEIRALCRERGITFTEVDLRWGLTDEDIVLGQVIRTCLEEIDKCRPYFIGITGERYGYVPDYVDIQKDPSLLERYPWVEDAVLDGASIIDLEFQHAALRAPNDCARFFFRRGRNTLEQSGVDEESVRLEALKQRVRQAGYTTDQFRDSGSLGELVYDELVEIIKRDFAGTRPPSELEQERSRHEAFAASRRHAYIASPEYVRELNAWNADASAPPLVIYAESGSGKSSLVSFWCQQLRRRSPEAFMIEHYVGIGAGATDHYAIMRHVMSEIREHFGRSEEIPSKPKDLEAEFGNWLGFTVGEPLLLVIDGINQLSGRALDLHWIPPVMPPGVKLIVTSTVEQTLVDLRARSWRTLAMQPLKEREREGVIVRYLSEYHKALSKQQITRLAEDVKCAHPLFLRTLLEELRLDSSHEKLDGRIDLYLKTSGTEDLFQQVLERMEDDFSTRAVREMMSFLWCSRFGLNEEELVELTEISRLKLSTMVGGLDYHLVRKDGQLTFFHDYLRRAVEKRYLTSQEQCHERWRALEARFERQPVTLRSTQELLHALEATERTQRLREVLAELARLELLWRDDRHAVLRWWAAVSPQEVASAYGPAASDIGVTVNQFRCATALLELVGSYEAARVLAEAWEDLAEQQGERSSVVEALVLRSSVALTMGDPLRAEEHAGRAEAIARELGDRRGVSLAVGNCGKVYYARGEYAEALRCIAEQEAIARELGDHRTTSGAVGNRGIVYFDRGDYDEALRCHAEQETITRELGDRRGVSIAVGNRGNVYYARGEYDEALRCIAEQEAIARGLGDRRVVALAVGNSGNVYSARGEYDEALRCYAEQETIARELGDRRSVSFAVGNRATVYYARGEYDEALRCCAEQAAIARELGDRPIVAKASLNRVSALLGRNQHQGASTAESLLDALKESLEISATLGIRGLVRNASMLQARIEALAGHADAARTRLAELLTDAVGEAERAECHYWLWRLSLDPATDHRADAERLYAELLCRIPRHDYRLKLEELRAASAASTPTEPTDASS